MIAERIQQSYSSAKYYQFYTVATILEHVIDCFNTIVNDENNPYHPPLSWLTRKQLKPPREELFLDLYQECSAQTNQVIDTCDTNTNHNNANEGNNDKKVIGSKNQLSSCVQARLEKCSKELRKNIVNRAKDGCSPFFMACKLGHYNIAKYLLEHCEADIEQRGRFETLEDHHAHSVSPLWVASVSGNLEIVKLLIDNNANVNSLSDTGSTPLRSVCFKCRDDDSSNQQQYSDLDNVVENENNDKEGEDDNEDDDLFVGTGVDEQRYLQIVKLLVENDADISRPNFNGGTCLINSIHNYKLTKYLIKHGAKVNASDYQSKTALHYAILRGRVEVTKLLLLNGADPMLQTNCHDDALQLSCLGGNLTIFEHLIKQYQYSKSRLADAYKLIGSSILELHYDITKVRELWLRSLKINSKQQTNYRSSKSLGGSSSSRNNRSRKENNCLNIVGSKLCYNRRLLAYGDISEFRTESELQSLTTDDFRIQSLLISERILGPDHRETIQRLLYRGTFYINSLMPNRCVDILLYALNLKLSFESIFQFESIFAAQAISKLFLDILSQQQQQQAAKFQDIHDVLSLLINQLDGCRKHLSQKPIFNLNQDIFDLLLEIILKLLIALDCTSTSIEHSKQTSELIKILVDANPKTSNGSTLLHLCVAQGLISDAACKLIATSAKRRKEDSNQSPIIKLIDTFVEHGLEVDSANDDGLSALQVLCLSNVRATDKRLIIRQFVKNGAHLDRRSISPEQGNTIQHSLRDAGIDPIDHLKLSCLAAKKISEIKIQFNEETLSRSLRDTIAIH